MFDKDLHDCIFRYVQNLNLPPVTNTMNGRNYVESDREELKEEEDEKSISLGMPMQPQEEDEEGEVEEEWSSYPSPTPNNGIGVSWRGEYFFDSDKRPDVMRKK